MHGVLLRSDYYEASAPPDGPQPATGLPLAEMDARRLGRPRAVPTFTTESIKEGGVHLYPDSIATATPQAFTVTSPPDTLTGFGVEIARSAVDLTRCAPARIRQI